MELLFLSFSLSINNRFIFFWSTKIASMILHYEALNALCFKLYSAGIYFPFSGEIFL